MKPNTHFTFATDLRVHRLTLTNLSMFQVTPAPGYEYTIVHVGNGLSISLNGRPICMVDTWHMEPPTPDELVDGESVRHGNPQLVIDTPDGGDPMATVIYGADDQRLVFEWLNRFEVIDQPEEHLLTYVLDTRVGEGEEA